MKNFQNYNFTFEKNEKKIISAFLKQSLRQMGDGKEYVPYIKAYNSILDKLSSGEEEIKLTKDEKFKLKDQLKANLDGYKKQLKKSNFIKKWLYRSMIKQYEAILESHFGN